MTRTAPLALGPSGPRLRAWQSQALAAATRRIGGRQEDDERDNDQCGRADLGAVHSLAAEQNAQRNREDDAAHEHRLHDCQPAVGQCRCLSHEAQTVTGDPSEPDRSPGQPQHETGVGTGRAILAPGSLLKHRPQRE